MRNALSSNGRRLRPALALAGVFALAGWGACPGRSPAPAAVPCEATEGELAAGARADALAGAFRLTLVATRGARVDESASGDLRLQPFGGRPVPLPAAEGVRYALFGGADVEIDGVGAVSRGPVDVADAARPGVLAMEWTNASAGTKEITLRFGSDANHGTQVPFDGAYLALKVRAVSADGFAGTWESGAGQPQAGGHFCAVRIAG